MTVWQIAVVVGAGALLLLLVVAVLTLRTLRQIRSLIADGAAVGAVRLPPDASPPEAVGPTDPLGSEQRVTVAERRQDRPVTSVPVDVRRTSVPEVPTTISAGYTDRADRLTSPRITSGAVVHGFRTAFAAARSRRETAEMQAAAGRSRRVSRGGGTEKVGQQR